MATATAFLHLKRLLTGIESTSQRLKANIVDDKSSKSFVGAEGDDYVVSLEKKVQDVQLRLDSMEASVCGAVEIRLSQVTMLEILQKCKTLHIANEEMIMAAERRMVAYGYTPPMNSTDILPALKVREISEQFSKVATRINNDAIEMDPQSIDSESISHRTPSPSNDRKAGVSIDIEDVVGHHAAVEDRNTAEFSNQNSTFNSPAANKMPQSEHFENEVKTPALPEWKLSQATRMLVLKGEAKENLNKSVLQATSTPVNTYFGHFDDVAAQTPGALDLSYPSNAQTGHSSLNIFESEIVTPKQITGTAYKTQASLAGGDSPATPNFGTPFHTTHLRNVNTTAAPYPSANFAEEVKVNLAESLSMSAVSESALQDVAAAATKESSPTVPAIYSGVDSPAMTTPCLLRERRHDGDSNSLHYPISSPEDSVLQPFTLQLSPPRMAILAPKPANILAELRPSAIPEVTVEEWDSAPAFLRKQVRHREDGKY